VPRGVFVFVAELTHRKTRTHVLKIAPVTYESQQCLSYLSRYLSIKTIPFIPIPLPINQRNTYHTYLVTYQSKQYLSYLSRYLSIVTVPVMDGWELRRREYSGPVIGLSANAHAPSRWDDAGMTFMRKFRASAFVTVVLQYCRLFVSLFLCACFFLQRTCRLDTNHKEAIDCIFLHVTTPTRIRNSIHSRTITFYNTSLRCEADYEEAGLPYCARLDLCRPSLARWHDFSFAGRQQ
jgi:hypothetical protein